MWELAKQLGLKLVLPILALFFERYRKRTADTPENRRDAIHEAIAKSDENEVTRLMDDALRKSPPPTKDKFRE